MGCLSKHRQKQKHGCSSLAWSLGEVAFIQDCTVITAGPPFIIFPPGWSTGLEKAVPAWDIAMGMTPGASVVTVPAQELPRETLHPADLTGSAQQQQEHRLLFQRVLCLCLPIICLVGECIGRNKLIYHYLFSWPVKDEAGASLPPPHYLSPWGHVVREQQLS